MGRYIIRRLLAVALLMVVILVTTFGIFFAIPSDPALRSCGRYCSPEKIAQVRHKLGTDKSIYEQFWLYSKGLVQGRDFGEGTEINHCPAPCLGVSFKTDIPVRESIEQNFPVTFSIAIGAAVLWLIAGITTGVISALKPRSKLDRGIVAVATASLSLPTQFVGLMLLYVVCAKGGVQFPKYVPFADNPLLWAKNLLLPWITLAFISSAIYTRLTRSQLVEVMHEDYIRTARGKGMTERRTVYKHGLRAALPPMIVIFGLDIGALLGGAIITERIFGMPGLGTLAVKSINDVDLPVILGVTLFGAFIVLMANLVVDVLYALTDPKITFS